MTLGGGLPVCMRCGSGGIRQQSTGDGLWPAGGEGVAWVCDDCGHIGAPFLLDRAPAPASDDETWRQELTRTSHEVDDDAWHRRPTAPRRWAPFGGLLMLLGLLFLAPGLLSLQSALASLHPWAVVRALVATGWLSAIGIVLVVVGLRRLRPDPPAALPT